MIGCNPADAGEDRDDPTALWWIRWCQHYGFGGYDAVNFYSFVASDPKVCRERVRNAFSGYWHDRDELFANRDHVARIAKAADQIFVCFRSEEHTSELQSLMRNSYAVFFLKKKTK